MCFKWYLLGKKEYEAKCRAIEEEKEYPSKEWNRWMDILDRMSAECQINSLTRAIQAHEMYKEVIAPYGDTVGIDIDIAKLKTEKKYKERLYKEKYGD